MISLAILLRERCHRLPWRLFPDTRKLEAARDTRYLTLRVSVQCRTFSTLLVALNRRDANTPAQDRGQLGVAEFVNGAVIVDRRVDYLHGLAFEAIGDLLERPTLLVLDRALDKLLGELVDLLALLLVVWIDAIEAQRIGEYCLPRLATRIARDAGATPSSGLGRRRLLAEGQNAKLTCAPALFRLPAKSCYNAVTITEVPSTIGRSAPFDIHNTRLMERCQIPRRTRCQMAKMK